MYTKSVVEEQIKVRTSHKTKELTSTLRFWYRRSTFVLYFALFFVFGFPFSASAFNPQITYQGKLTNASGLSVTDGVYDIKFVIYDSETGGTCRYTLRGSCASTTAASTTVASGIFSVVLGDTGAGHNAFTNSIFASSSLFLGVTVGTDSEMSPRKRLTAAPYAFNADYLGGVTTSTTGGTTSYIPATNSNGNLTITGSPQGTGVSQGSLYINPSSVTSGYTILGIAQGGTEVFRVGQGGTVAASSTLLIGGAGTFNSTLGVTSLSTLTGGFISSASSSIGAGLQVAGALNASSTLLVNNLSTLTGGFISSASSTVNGNFQVSGALNVSNTISGIQNVNVFGDGSSGGRLRVYNSNNTQTAIDLYNSGGEPNITVADSANTITITTVGIDSESSFPFGIRSLRTNQHINLTPAGRVGVNTSTPLGELSIQGNADVIQLVIKGNSTQTNALTTWYNTAGTELGSFDNSGNLQADGTILASGALRSSSTLLIGTAAGTDNFFVNGVSTRVGSSSATGSLEIFGFVTTTGRVAPEHNASYDLGWYGNAWRSVYASTTLFLGGGSTTGTIMGRGGALGADNASILINTNGDVSTGNIFQVQDNGTNRLVINSSGNVGVGTSSPYTTFAVEGPVSGQRYTATSSGSQTTPSYNFIGGSGTGMFLGDDGRLAFSQGGNEFLSGIYNTSLTISGMNTLFMTVNSSQLRFSASPTDWSFGIVSGNLVMRTLDGSEAYMTFLNGTRNVNVGTSSGTSSLQVYGFVTTTGRISPEHNASYDLGWYGNAWRSIYASTTLFLGGGSTTGTISGRGGTLGTGNASIVITADSDVTSGNLLAIRDGGTGAVDRLTIDSDGVATIRGGLITNASSSIGAGLQVAGALSASGTLNVAGASTLASTLGVTSLSTLTGGFISSASSSISSSLHVSGNLNTSSSVFLSGVATTTPTSFSVAASIIPGANNTFDLGAYGTAFRSLYASTTLFLGGGSTTGTILGRGGALGADNASVLINTNGDVSSGNIFQVQDNNSNRFVIDADGHALIGGTSNSFRPSYTLEVRNPSMSEAAGVRIFGDGINAALHVISNTPAATSTLTHGSFILGITSSYPSGALIIDGSGNIQASGTLYMFGNTTLGNTTSSDIFYLNSRIADSLIPTANQALDLGEYSRGWRSLYASTTLFLGGGSTTGTILGRGGALGADNASILINTNGDVSSGNIFQVQDNGTNRLVIDASGNVGISSSTPAYVLSVGGTSYLGGNTIVEGTLLATGNTTFGSGSSAGRVTINSQGSEDLLVIVGSTSMKSSDRFIEVRAADGSTPVLTFATTTNSNYELNIGTAANDSGSIVVNGNSTFGYTTSSHIIYLKSRLAGSLIPTANQALDLGEYSRSWRSLYASTTLFLGGGSTTGTILGRGGALGADNASVLINTNGDVSTGNIFQVQDNGTNRLVIDASGNVGVASSTPGFALSVGGTSYFSATSTVGNLLDVRGKIDAPILQATLDTPVQADDVFVSGNYAYVADDTGGLQIIDVSSSTPQLVATFDTSGEVNAVYVAGKYAYIADGTSNRLRILDISNPKAPRQVGSYNEGGLVGDVVVSGNYAYIGNATSGNMRIVDISDPTNPRSVGNVTAATSQFLYVSGRYAYGGRNALGMSIIDISDPTNPVVLSTFDTSGTATQVHVLGRYAYVADSLSGLQIIDISDPYSPTLAGTYNTSVDANDVFVSGNYAYVADDTGGLVIVDVTNPSDPTLVGTYNTSGRAFDVFVSGNRVFIADLAAGLQIIDIAGAVLASSEIGTAKITTLQVMNDANFNSEVNVGGGLKIGNSGLLLSGDFGMSASSSLVTATNTLSFSHRTLFQSSVTSTAPYVYVFDTLNTITSSTSNYLFSVRNNTMRLFSVSTNGDTRVSGTLYAASATVGSPGNPGDVAERVDIRLGESVESGDVMIVDQGGTDTYHRSQKAHESGVAGIVSTNPTIIVGEGKTANTAVLALVGRVPVKVSDENGPIQAGDFLVTASTSGYAMKYDASKIPKGATVAVVGTALEAHEKGIGKILVLLKDSLVTSSASSQLTVEGASGLITDQSPGLLPSSITFLGNSVHAQNDDWYITEDGRFVVTLETSTGKKPFTAIASPETELLFSGSGKLDGGFAQIDFSEEMRSVIDQTVPIIVQVTLTQGTSMGIYVSEKTHEKFVVQELGGGLGVATFDWIIIARRKGYGVQVPESPGPVGEELIPAESSVIEESVPEENPQQESLVEEQKFPEEQTVPETPPIEETKVLDESSPIAENDTTPEGTEVVVEETP